jgi:DNA gyrase subunit A
MVRTRTDEVPLVGRNTQGVRVIRTKEGEFLVGVERIEEPPALEVDLFDAAGDPVAGEEESGDDGAE